MDSLNAKTAMQGLAWVGAVSIGLAISLAIPGCGTTKSVTATEQLLMSDAVDSTIAKIDFRPLTGYKVFLDTTYLSPAGKPIPGVPMPANLVTSDYVTSSLRQQLTAAGCMLVDNKDHADIICEARCGALGTDGHNVTYGLPPVNLFGSTSTILAAAPSLPTIPEISVAKKEVKSAASKVAVFAYDRETREPLWQSGVAQAGSNAKDTWFLGIGPIQQGTIYRGPRFAGRRFGRERIFNDDHPKGEFANGIDLRTQFTFANPLFSPSGTKEQQERLAVEDSGGDKKDGSVEGEKKGVRAKLASDPR